MGNEKEPPAILVCMPCSNLAQSIPGALRSSCKACGCDVWVSPATLKNVDYQPFETWCVWCVGPRLTEAPFEPLSAEQELEIARSMGLSIEQVRARLPEVEKALRDQAEG